MGKKIYKVNSSVMEKKKLMMLMRILMMTILLAMRIIFLNIMQYPVYYTLVTCISKHPIERNLTGSLRSPIRGVASSAQIYTSLGHTHT